MIKETISKLKNGYDEIENKNFQKASEIFVEILENDSKNAQAYLGMLLAENRVSNISQLGDISPSFSESENFKNAKKHGDKDLVYALDHYLKKAQKLQREKELQAQEISHKLESLEQEELPVEIQETQWQKETREKQEKIADEIRHRVQTKNKKKKKILISAFSVLLLLSVSLSSFLLIRTSNRKKQIIYANELFEKGEFVQAYQTYFKLESDEKISHMTENAQNIAKEAADRGDYEEACSFLALVGKSDTEAFGLYELVKNGEYRKAIEGGLTSLTLPETLTEVPTELFCDCTSLKSVTIPEGVKEIKAFAFEGCTSLEKVILPSTVSTIRENSFMGCKSLKGITIPKNVTTIERMSFFGCESLVDVLFEDQNGWKIDGVSFVFSSKELLCEALTETIAGTWKKES
jgi:hypothetical protein